MNDTVTSQPSAAPAAPTNETVGELVADQSFMSAWLNADHPNHRAAVARKSAAANRPPVADPYTNEQIAAGFDEQAERGFTPDTEAAINGAYEPPATADEYTFTLPVDRDADPAQSIQDQKTARLIAHAVGAPDGLARDFVNLYQQAMQNPPSPETQAYEQERVEAKLRGELGDDRFEAGLAAARVLVARGGPALREVLGRSGLINNEYLIKRLISLAEARGFVPS